MFRISLFVITKSESVPDVFVFHHLVLNLPILLPILLSKFLFLLGLSLIFVTLKLSPLRLGGRLGAEMLQFDSRIDFVFIPPHGLGY